MATKDRGGAKTAKKQPKLDLKQKRQAKKTKKKGLGSASSHLAD